MTTPNINAPINASIKPLRLGGMKNKVTLKAKTKWLKEFTVVPYPSILPILWGLFYL